MNVVGRQNYSNCQLVSEEREFQTDDKNVAEMVSFLVAHVADSSEASLEL